MSIDGHVYRITDLELFFLPVLAGAGPPADGYKPWPGVEVRAWAVDTLLPIPLPGGSATTNTDGSFSIQQQLPNPGLGDSSDVRAALSISDGAFPYNPLYRSDLDLLVNEAESTELNVWLYPDTIPVEDGVSAGSVDGMVKGAGLPGNTTITAGPSGLAFSGSSDGANIEFGISIRPDTSFTLSSYLDLALASWHIDVGWPADWCTNAEDILVEIIAGLQGAGSSMNAAALSKLEGVFEEHIPLAEVAKTFFTSEVSVTFMDVGYPNHHSWSLSDTGDDTIVVTADPCIGYPLRLTSDPSKRHPIKPRRLSRTLRPVLT